MRFFRAALLLWACLAQAADDASDVAEQLKRFVDVYALVERQSAEPVDSGHALLEGAIPGMLKRLDPHSVFFDPDHFNQLKELESSFRKGFGSVVSILPGRVIFLQTLAGTPSARAGIMPGDEILAVNGIALGRLEPEQLMQLLSQSRSMRVKLDVRRPGNARMLEFILTPETLDAPSVDRTFALEGGFGYIRMSNFEKETGKEMREAIEKLGGDKLKGLVLDLRNNPGGVLEAALETTALFLPANTLLLSVRGRGSDSEEVKVPESLKHYNFPLAVLVDEKSASASEIVAGGLQDHDRAVILGQPTYGKGLVQRVFPLSRGAGLALTTAFYYTPSGRSIQKPLKDAALDPLAFSSNKGKSPEYRTAKGRIVKGGGGIQPDEVVSPEPVTRFRAVLEATGSFTTFATEFLQKNRVADDRFSPSPAILDDFRVFLSARRIQPGIAEWTREREWIQARLKQEVLNQALGVAKGDEVEVGRDPVVRKAIEALTRK